jgi:hypothetical protein
MLRWTAASDRETPCVKMLKQFLKALYLILYSEHSAGNRCFRFFHTRLSAGSPKLLEQKRTGSKYDKNEQQTLFSQRKLAFSGRNM